MKTAVYFEHNFPTWKTMMMGAFACLSLAGCRDQDFNWDSAYSANPDYVFAKEFHDQFGAIDPTHDWSTGTVINADVDLSAWVSGDAVLRVMSSMPIHDDCVMLYKGTISGASTISFDAPRYLSHVYVTAEQNGKYVLGQYFEIKDKTCNIKATETRGKTNETCPTRKNENKKVDLKINGITYSTKYYLTNVQSSKTNATSLTIKDLDKYVGYTSNAYFTERHNNRDQYAQVFSKDVIYTVAEEGPVWIDCFFGGTAYCNQVGYYYYTEGNTAEKTKENKIRANKYVIIDDARPSKIVTVSDAPAEYPSGYPGMRLPEYWIQGYEHYNGKNNRVTGDEIATGTKYRLVYFDGENASYNFPKGTKIGFFIHKIGDDNWGNSWTPDESKLSTSGAMVESNTSNIRYSDTDLNSFYNPTVKYKGQDYWAAVSCRIGDKIVCGFEDEPTLDNSDHDMNDILFFIEGVDPEDVPDIPIEEPDLNECMIAYEDMGMIGDFDFNDVVISVSTRDASTGLSTIKLYAAGGTLNTKVIYKDVNGEIELKFGNPVNVATSTASTDGTEVHDAFGVSQKTMVNTGLAEPNVNYTPTARIQVSEGWTVNANKQRFALKVQKSEGEDKIINIPYTAGEVPQAFLIADKNWTWPTERQHISNKYPTFPLWVENNLANSTWYAKAWGEK